MSNAVESICAEINHLDGVIGAFVWHAGHCLGCTLPSKYDSGRVAQLGRGLQRLVVLAQTGGRRASPSILRWQHMSLYAWTVREDALLAVLTSPGADRTALDAGVSCALEGLDGLLRSFPIASTR